MTDTADRFTDLPGQEVQEHTPEPPRDPAVLEGSVLGAPPPPPPRRMLGREDILKADDRPIEEVDVPEWGGVVLVRGMTGKDRDEYFASQVEQRGRKVVQNLSNASASIAARCIVDPDDHDKLLFTVRDIAELGERSSAALERVGQVASRLSGLTEEDVEALGKT